MREQLSYYLRGQASSWPVYILEQLVLGLCSWVPTVIGIGLRGLFYRLIMKLNGVPAIEVGVRIAHANGIKLGKGVYLDQGVYLHALPGGISIGDSTFVMHHTMLHVFNFRNLPQAGITIGSNCFIGEFNVVRGQGGVRIGNGVYTGPMVQIVAVNHVYQDPKRPIREQGITAQGIVIEDDVWIGAGATIVDGVTVGQGSVIGAGAVVTSNIPPFSIAVGTPAKPIRDRRELSANHRQVEVFFGALEEIRQ
ncbi:MAG: acyltransferase [Anaerolineae bacterium]|nr:acyltransferase [Anaerolineales bacterium]MCQ3976719.1 acyltransferase [Anaerolineae bacterium]